MLIIAVLLIDAAILGNIGSMLGAIIDPSNMVDNSSSATTSSTTSTSSGTVTA